MVFYLDKDKAKFEKMIFNFLFSKMIQKKKKIIDNFFFFTIKKKKYIAFKIVIAYFYENCEIRKLDWKKK